MKFFILCTALLMGTSAFAARKDCYVKISVDNKEKTITKYSETLAGDTTVLTFNVQKEDTAMLMFFKDGTVRGTLASSDRPSNFGTLGLLDAKNPLLKITVDTNKGLESWTLGCGNQK